jgi:glycine cleavage system aminomethyltransferase T
VDGKRRFTVFVAAEVGYGREVSVRLTSSTPFLAERPLYYYNVHSGLVFEGATDGAGLRGAPLTVGATVVGRVTSAERSPVLDRAIGLGWIRRVGDGFPNELRAGSAVARVVPTPFYDREGTRVRG